MERWSFQRPPKKGTSSKRNDVGEIQDTPRYQGFFSVGEEGEDPGGMQLMTDNPPLSKC